MPYASSIAENTKRFPIKFARFVRTFFHPPFSPSNPGNGPDL